MLTETNDVSIINAIKNVFKTQKKDFWEELTQEQRDEIKDGEREIERGEFVDFYDLMEEIKIKYHLKNNLFCVISTQEKSH